MSFIGFRGALACAVTLVVWTSSASAQYVPPAGTIKSVNGGGPWSSPTTWIRGSGVGAIPGPGDIVGITNGNPVVLDTNVGIQDLAGLDVNDRLVVQDTQLYRLGVSRMTINVGGSFIVGTSGTRFVNDFTLRLTDTWLGSPHGHAQENRTLLVSGGAISMHGNNTVTGGGTQVSWLRLQNGNDLTANVSNTLTLEAAPGWTGGDVVIASTDFDMNQAEVRTIQSVVGNVVTLTSVVGKNHHGTIESGIVDERAEVGLLSRNVRIVGPLNALANQRGGHCMFVKSPAPASIVPVVHFDWVEFRDLGWFGAKGRYPLHIHEIGTAPGTYVKGCAIRRSFNRAIAIHDSNNVLLQDNVAYDVIGHAYYLEDGGEIDNDLLHNLGLVTKVPPLPSGVATWGDPWPTAIGGTGTDFFVASDKEVSTFWIPNTDNTFHDNAAAGSEVHGIWYDLPDGVVEVEPVRFERNVAHSNGENGFHNEESRFVTVDASLPNPYDTASEFKDFTGYKNRNAAIWNRAYGVVRWIRARVADNAVGVYFASEGFQHDYQTYLAPPFVPFPVFLDLAPQGALQTLEDSDVLGETNNRGNPDLTNVFESGWPGGPRSLPNKSFPQFELKGIELYDGLVALIAVRFRDFQDAAMPATNNGFAGGVLVPYTHRASMAIGARGHHSGGVVQSPWAFDPRNLIIWSTFTNVAHPVLFPQAHPPHPCPWITPKNEPPPGGANACGSNGIVSSLVYDVDGSIPGGGPSTYWVNNTNLMRPIGAPTPVLLPNLTAYAAPLAVPGPGTVADRALGQFMLAMYTACTPTPINQAIQSVTFTPTARPTQAFEVFDAISSACPTGPLGFRNFPITLLLNDTALPGTSEEYVLTYTAGHVATNDPRDLFWEFGFSTPGRHCLIGIPYGGLKAGVPAPPSLVVFSAPGIPGLVVTGVPVGSKAALLTGIGNEYFWDNTTNQLWFRPITLFNTPSVLPILDGRGLLTAVLN